MATSIISVITGIPIRRDVAMTGEVTLRGRALPIGGLKEKLLAALRAGITTVIIPKENEKDLAEVPDNVKTGLKIVPVASMGEVLTVALVREPEAIDWVEPEADACRACRWTRAMPIRWSPTRQINVKRGPDVRPGPFFWPELAQAKIRRIRAFSPWRGRFALNSGSGKNRVAAPAIPERPAKRSHREQERSHPEACGPYRPAQE